MAIDEPLFLSVSHVIAIHESEIKKHGGHSGLRDYGLLESAVLHPQLLYLYQDDVDVFTLASALAVKIINNHPFLDGNKRTGMLSAIEFLSINGYTVLLNIDKAEKWAYDLAQANGAVEGFACFLREAQRQ